MWICSHKQRYIKNSRRTVPTYKQQPKMPQDINLVMSPHLVRPPYFFINSLAEDFK